MLADTVKHTPGPWTLCHHLQSMERDGSCSCGYRGVIYGPETDVPMAVCQPGHDAEPAGEEFTGPQRYSRDVELANAHLIAAAPDLLEALRDCLGRFVEAFPASAEYEPIKRGFAAIAKAEGRS